MNHWMGAPEERTTIPRFWITGIAPSIPNKEGPSPNRKQIRTFVLKNYWYKLFSQQFYLPHAHINSFAIIHCNNAEHNEFI